MLSKRFLKKLLFPVLSRTAKIYLSKERTVRYDSIEVSVQLGIFHPGLFFSTKILLDFIKPKNLLGVKFLELGCGSGIISILAAKSGAIVTASDINHKAVDNTRFNSQKNGVDVKVIISDLFDNILDQKFDWIIVNPPFYPKEVNKIDDLAWFCGSDFQFFRKFFFQLRPFINYDSNVIMILSEDCDIKKIKLIALENNFTLEEIFRKKSWLEWNYIYKIIPAD
jgi:release factor glutamine methyltransferase